MKFRKKSVDVEAVRFDTGYMGPAVTKTRAGNFVTTIQGIAVPIQVGEWIMPEPDSIHFYPCADRGDGLAPLGYEPIP